MKSKKGLELSINVVVMLIFAILIFSLSIYLLFKWFGGAQELEQEIDRQTQEQILQTLRSGNQLVATPFSLQEVKRGNFAKFGIGVRNIGADRRFGIVSNFSEAYAPDGREIAQKEKSFIEEKWLGGFKSLPPFLLKKNQQEVMPLIIKADVNTARGVPTPKGDYVFNLCVYVEGPPPPDCLPENRKSFYTEKVYQVTVRVV